MSAPRFNLRAFTVVGSLLSAFACGGAESGLAELDPSELASPSPDLASLPEEESILGVSRASLAAPEPLPLELCLPGVNATGVTSFNGGADSDTVTGTINDDMLRGGDCHDTLSGTAGNDVIEGEAGDDTLLAGNGDDVVRGGDGDDVVQGGNQNDELFGGPGADLVEGGNGDDTLHGGCGPQVDTLDGGTGYDVCEGNCERDIFAACEEIVCC